MTEVQPHPGPLPSADILDEHLRGMRRTGAHVPTVRAGFLLLALLLSHWCAPPLRAQEPAAVLPTPDYQPLGIDRGSSGLWQLLKKLNTRAGIMMITAHPDDEDGGMLTYESRGEGAQVTLLSLNRGEGGQNLMSNDLWDRLALVRTQELLAADRYYGVDRQYFTRVVDFGFSKTIQEALTLWGHDRVLYDVVRAVRLERPLVVTSVFVGGITDGHGQHQVAGEMAQEVFKAAGDPSVFPDQIKAGLLPWSPIKVYARVPYFSVSPKGMYDYATGQWAPVRFHDYVADTWSTSVPSTNLTIPEGKYDPVLGCSYIQLARRGLGLQKSQNGGAGIPLNGAFAIPYHRYASRAPTSDSESSFFDGIDVSIAGIASLAPGHREFLAAGLRQIAASVQQAIAAFSVSHPEQVAPSLVAGLRQTQSLMRQVEASGLTAEAKFNILHELGTKQTQFNQALVISLGVTLTAVVAPPGPQQSRSPFAVDAPDSSTTTVIPGQSFAVAAYLTDSGSIPVQIASLSLHATGPESPSESESWHIALEKPVTGDLKNNQRVEARFHVTVPPGASPTRPYFHRDSVEQPYYDIDDPRYLNQPLSPYPLEAQLDFIYNGTRLRLAQVVQTVHHLPGPGAIYLPLVVVPAISVATSAVAGIVPLDSKAATVTVTVRSNIMGSAQGAIHLQSPPAWVSSPQSAAFQIANHGEQQDLSFSLAPVNLEAKAYQIAAIAGLEGREYSTGYVTVGYPGLRPYNVYRPAAYRLTGVDVKVAPGLKVGYVMGTGDAVPESLKSLGISVHLLDTAEIVSGDLSRYDVIVLGIRAYAARPELAAANSRILDYVHRGGVVVVQYNSREYDHDYGPYPYTLTSDPEKVVDEHAAVNLLAPQNPVLSWPNRITADDFQGWVEERGHSFMQSWDPRYEALLATHDPGQDVQRGGLLYARYGRGAYVYVALALYRQLPEGIPGAYRLFANLLSLPRAPLSPSGK